MFASCGLPEHYRRDTGRGNYARRPLSILGSEPRMAAPSSGETLRMDGHFVQFYEGDAFLVDEVTRFIGSGLMTGDAGVVIATKAHRDALGTRLQPPSSDAGAYLMLDAEETLERSWSTAPPTRSVQRHDRRVIRRRAGTAADGCAPSARWWRCCGTRASPMRRSGSSSSGTSSRSSTRSRCSAPTPCAPSSAAKGRQGVHARLRRAHAGQARRELCRIPSDDVEALNRIVARLQQKASALETEVARRKETEHALERRERELADFVENAVEGLHRVGAGRHASSGPTRPSSTCSATTPEEYVGHHVAEFHADRQVMRGHAHQPPGRRGRVRLSGAAALQGRLGAARPHQLERARRERQVRLHALLHARRHRAPRLEAELRERWRSSPSWTGARTSSSPCSRTSCAIRSRRSSTALEILKLPGDDPRRITPRARGHRAPGRST